jgi:uncharacterized membrane protein YkoI
MHRPTTLIAVTAFAAVGIAAGGTAIVTAQDDSPPADLDGAVGAALGEVGDGQVTGVEQEHGGGYEVEVRRPDGSEIDVRLDRDFVVTGTDHDAEDDGDDLPLDDATRSRAEAAALDAAGGGTVTEVEADGGGYDVEVRMDAGTSVDVELDAAFAVLAIERD